MSNLAKYLNYNHTEDIKNTLNGLGMEEFFTNTEIEISKEEHQVSFNRVLSDKYSLEDWNDLTYETNHGDTIKIPKGILAFRDFVHDRWENRTFNKTFEVETLIFNPALDGKEITSVKGDKYKGVDCKFMIPVFYFLTVDTTTIGKTRIESTIPTMAVLVADPNDARYGKIGFFTAYNATNFKNFSLKDAWGFFKWFQPDFSTDANSLVSKFETILDKLTAMWGKMKDKITKLFGKKKKED